MKKAPTTKKRKGMKIQGVEPDKKSSYTDKKGKTVELKRYKSKEYKRTTDPDATKETRRATRRTNTLELSKTKTKKDGTTKTKVKRAAGGTKKAERLTGQFKKGARKEGASDVKIERKSIAKMKKSPSKMKHKSMAKMKDKSMAKMKSPAKKPLVGKQKNLPEHLKKAILDAPAKMLSKSGMKMMKEGSPAKLKKKESPAKMKAPMKKSKKKVEQDYARNAIADYKAGKKKQGNYEKKKALELAAGESGVMMKKPVTKTKTIVDGRKVKNKLKKGTIKVKIQGKDGGKGRKFVVNTNMESLNPSGRQTLSDPNKYKSRRAARKAADSPSMMKNPMMMKTNQSGGGYAAKNPAAPARQLKKLGTILSKHMKSK
jgi:hypothetical protein